MQICFLIGGMTPSTILPTQGYLTWFPFFENFSEQNFLIQANPIIFRGHCVSLLLFKLDYENFQ